MSIMGDISFASLPAILPEFYLLIATLFLLIYGVYRLQKSNNFLVGAGILILAFTGVLICYSYGMHKVAMNTMFVTDAFASYTKLLLVISGMLVLLLSTAWLKEEEGRPFEFVILLLLSTLGSMFMVSANNMLTLYMSLEMSSLALYVLASFSRDHARSSEAGLKYFVLGALASGMMLFGISLVYGFTGSTSFDSLAQLFVVTSGGASKAVIVGIILIVIGLSFKISAVPFHMWTPDVYEGAPTPVTAFFATAPKIAALALFTRVMLVPFGGLALEWQQVLIFISVVSMALGALAAIMQTNIKRLLAYSSIGHAGYMLMGIAAANSAGVQAVLIYSAIYMFMSAGAFGCVLLMKRNGHAVEDIKELRGLSQTHPLMAIVISIFMFSLAGIPPLAGFFGKLYVIMAAISSGLNGLAVIAVVTSVIGGFYYIKIVKIMYFDEPATSFDSKMPLSARAGVLIAVLFTSLFFLIPTPLVAPAKAAAEALLK